MISSQIKFQIPKFFSSHLKLILIAYFKKNWSSTRGSFLIMKEPIVTLSILLLVLLMHLNNPLRNHYLPYPNHHPKLILTLVSQNRLLILIHLGILTLRLLRMIILRNWIPLAFLTLNFCIFSTFKNVLSSRESDHWVWWPWNASSTCKVGCKSLDRVIFTRGCSTTIWVSWGD